MINVDCIKEYIIPVSQEIIDSTIRDCHHTMFTAWFDDQINVFMNCSKHLSNGQNLIMTTDIRYNHEMSITAAMIETFCETDDEKEEYYKRLIDKHLSNLEYESKNPPTYEIKKKSKNSIPSKRVRRNKQTSLFKEEKPQIDLTKVKLKIKI